MKPGNHIFRAFLLLVSLNVWGVATSYARVVVFDVVTLQHREVRLKVRTLKSVLPAGGTKVALTIEGEMERTILTGIDGYGFISFTPVRAGLKIIHAACTEGVGTGILLVVTPKEKAVVLEVESGIQQMILSEEGVEGMKKAIQPLREDFRIVFLSRLFGLTLSRQLLLKFGISGFPVLGFDGPCTFKPIRERGVNLHALVASDAVISTESIYFDRGFSFEKGTHGTRLKNWNQVPRELGLDGN